MNRSWFFLPTNRQGQFYFGPEFSNLLRVEIPTYGWSLDNLVVSVPEPGAGSLALAGLGAGWFFRTRAQSQFYNPKKSHQVKSIQASIRQILAPHLTNAARREAIATWLPPEETSP